MAAPPADSTPLLSCGEGAAPGRAPAPAKPLSRWGLFPAGCGVSGGEKGGRREAGAAPAAVGLGGGSEGGGASDGARMLPLAPPPRSPPRARPPARAPSRSAV